MKQFFVYLCLTTLIFGCKNTQIVTEDLADSSIIVVDINIANTKKDKVPVEVNPGRFTKDTVIYRLPKVVQGTYENSDFGRFLENFKALDYAGMDLPVTKIDDNSWMIVNSRKLDRLTYWVNDTFDLESEMSVPFSPAGTNIEEENFVLNLHGFVGYFDSLKNNQYALTVTAPSDFTRTSALEEMSKKISDDGKLVTSSYFANRYFDITDNPMMYGNLSVEEFLVGNIKIVLSVYSPNGKHSASDLKEAMYKMMKAQKNYLGDLNSTPRYDIFLYLSPGDAKSPRGYGALEHHKSTVVVLRENSSKEELEHSMIDVVSHEFFHIVTPLALHSEDVHYFDYNNPTFSKHLWLYEGVTEYFAQHFQVYESLVTSDAYYKTLLKQIAVSKKMDDTMSFTTMSENILEEPYASNFYNVYQKGALIGMCLDILMREESSGDRSLLDLVKDLSKDYGTDKPFVDDNLIAEIGQITYPSVSKFFDKYVIGNEPIDYSKFLNKVGLIIQKKEVPTSYIRSSSSFIFKSDKQTGELLFANSVNENSFWRDQNIQPNDVLISVDGIKVNDENAREILGALYKWQSGDNVTFEFKHNDQVKTIQTVLPTTYTFQDTIVEIPNPTYEQIIARNAWLNLSEPVNEIGN
ncbi:M61 family metallopeptidase [Aegicerativicinus sediminis]|uniref:M61 family metallopeptidase n=1 Tax=Aegicerativicinus sediminis TaxID=2893202 RepID=UPI001E5D38AE|nr:PDZ domain-containing protein [Aegicerativicinus sediminis]